MRFNKSFVFSIAIICVLGNSSVAQDTAIYEVKTNLFSLGQMQAIQNIDESSHSKIYQLKSSFNLWSIYDIDYLLESKFVNNELVSTQAKITANHKIKHFCSVTKYGNYYIRTDDKKTDTLKVSSIKTGITRLYFEKFEGADSIFSEFSGNFDSFKKLNEHEYILGKEDAQEFFFNNQRVSKITVPNAILDFYIVLQ